MAATALHSKTGALPRPGSSGAPLPGLPAKPDMPDIPEDARKYPPPTRTPFGSGPVGFGTYPPPRPDFASEGQDSALPAEAQPQPEPEPEPEPEPPRDSHPGDILTSEQAPPAKPTMERKGRAKAAARPRSPEFKVHREEVEEILEKPRCAHFSFCCRQRARFSCGSRRCARAAVAVGGSARALRRRAHTQQPGCS